jgi:hypothetical protein
VTPPAYYYSRHHQCGIDCETWNSQKNFGVMSTLLLSS